MTKSFRTGELIRLKKTLIMGQVEAQFSTDEYYCTFDSETKLYNVNELSYTNFKQLREWLKYADRLSDRQILDWIDSLYQKRIKASKIIRIAGWVFVFWMFVMGFGMLLK